MISEACEREPDGNIRSFEPVEGPAIDGAPKSPWAGPERPRPVGNADDVEEEVVEGVAKPPLNSEAEGFGSACSPTLIAEVSIIVVPKECPKGVEFAKARGGPARLEIFTDPGHVISCQSAM
jgi:hypothetical protein